MNTVKYFYWEEDGAYLGYLQEFPDYWTQGESRDDLIEYLKDLYAELAEGHIPGARRLGELTVP